MLQAATFVILIFSALLNPLVAVKKCYYCVGDCEDTIGKWRTVDCKHFMPDWHNEHYNHLLPYNYRVLVDDVFHWETYYIRYPYKRLPPYCVSVWYDQRLVAKGCAVDNNMIDCKNPQLDGYFCEFCTEDMCNSVSKREWGIKWKKVTDCYYCKSRKDCANPIQIKCASLDPPFKHYKYIGCITKWKDDHMVEKSCVHTASQCFFDPAQNLICKMCTSNLCNAGAGEWANGTLFRKQSKVCSSVEASTLNLTIFLPAVVFIFFAN